MEFTVESTGVEFTSQFKSWGIMHDEAKALVGKGWHHFGALPLLLPIYPHTGSSLCVASTKPLYEPKKSQCFHQFNAKIYKPENTEVLLSTLEKIAGALSAHVGR